MYGICITILCVKVCIFIIVILVLTLWLTMIFRVARGSQPMVDGRSACTTWCPNAYHCLHVIIMITITFIHVHNTTVVNINNCNTCSLSCTKKLMANLCFTWTQCLLIISTERKRAGWDSLYTCNWTLLPCVNIDSSHLQSCTPNYNYYDATTPTWSNKSTKKWMKEDKRGERERERERREGWGGGGGERETNSPFNMPTTAIASSDLG